MTDKELYRIWAPLGKKWIDWVRPVPFVEIHEYSKQYNVTTFVLPEPELSREIFADAAVIVDLPGAESVEMGLALAGKGYRPIPAFNGTIEQPGARTTVDNQSVGMALMSGANQLLNMEIPEDALPAFLLDSNRLHRFRIDVNVFDNSWDIYAHDLPSAEYLLQNGIRKVVVMSDRISRDLKKILYGYQKKKIEIYLQKEYSEPKKVTIHKPLFEAEE